MDKKWNKVVLIALILSLSAIGLIIGVNITGFVVYDNSEAEVSITRLVEKDDAASLTNVKLSIVSNENPLAVKENFSDDSCSVLSYHVEPPIYLSDFNENENTWILANREGSLNVDLFYNISYTCDVIGGEYSILIQHIGWCNNSDINRDGKVSFGDFMDMQGNWHEIDCNIPGWCNNADIDRDGDVDFDDFTNMQGNWERTDCVSPSWCNNADIDRDGYVDAGDFNVVNSNMGGEGCTEISWCNNADISRDGEVDFDDFLELQKNWGDDCEPPIDELSTGRILS